MHTNKTKNSEFILTYTPAKHDGVDNWRGEEFTYHVSVSGEVFYNREHKNPKGFYGWDIEREDIRRFSWSRVNEIVALTE